jgi:excisionase family DNA binding protein
MRKAGDSPTKRVLRLRQAAEYLSVSTRAVRTLIQQGELSVVRFSENAHAPWLVDRHDLDGLVERKKTTIV